MQKNIPILFSTPMVQAILNGNKTQTRRIVKFPADFTGQVFNNGPYGLKYSSNQCGDTIQRLAYAEPGDILWVRETWNTLHEYSEKPDYSVMREDEFVYKAGEWRMDKWKPSIFMPKDACRLFLKVKSVRVERLQEISEADAVAEGVETLGLYPGYDVSSQAKFEGLWNKINKNWDDDPWVWVIEFERTAKPDNF